MDLRLTDDQLALREAARSVLSRESSSALVRARYDDVHARADALWGHIVDGGWTGIAVPEDDGGLGLTAVELALVLEEAGRVLAPIPLWETASYAVSLAKAAAASDLLKGIAGGQIRATGAIVAADATVADLVPEAHSADVVFVVRGDDVLAVPVATGDVRVHKTMDPTRTLCTVALSGAEPLGRVDEERLSAAREEATVGLAAELVGVARRQLEMTVDYVKVREQFGAPIGSFQAVQHMCANMLVDVERAAAAVAWAAHSVALGEPDSARATAIAKATAGDAARHAAKTSIQLHGGIGFTWEHDLHLGLRRVYTSEPLLGGAIEQRRRLADLLAL